MTGNILKNHILIVEDHADSAAMLSRLLTRSGYQVSTAGTVSTALELVSNHAGRPVQLVVSDLGLPDGTGYELMQQLRDNFQVPGIALSGYGQSSDVDRALAAGFFHHLTKPIDFDKLQKAIKQVLGE